MCGYGLQDYKLSEESLQSLFEDIFSISSSVDQCRFQAEMNLREMLQAVVALLCIVQL